MFISLFVINLKILMIIDYLQSTIGIGNMQDVLLLFTLTLFRFRNRTDTFSNRRYIITNIKCQRLLNTPLRIMYNTYTYFVTDYNTYIIRALFLAHRCIYFNTKRSPSLI